MFCAKCGNEIIENERFCNQCGNSTAGEETPGLTAASGLPLAVATKAKKTNPILIVALIMGGLLLVFMLSKGSFGGTLGTSNTPEGVTRVFMEAVVRGDTRAAANLCNKNDETNLIVGAAILQLTDFSSDYKIRHKPVTYKTTKQTDTKAKVTVYDEKSKAICTLELSNINGKWYIIYCS